MTKDMIAPTDDGAEDLNEELSDEALDRNPGFGAWGCQKCIMCISAQER